MLFGFRSASIFNLYYNYLLVIITAALIFSLLVWLSWRHLLRHQWCVGRVIIRLIKNVLLHANILFMPVRYLISTNPKIFLIEDNSMNYNLHPVLKIHMDVCRGEATIDEFIELRHHQAKLQKLEASFVSSRSFNKKYACPWWRLV